jgi:BirA family biotin operon repressor/biotin-[acetyl-CoA-carboxylase] ligase
MVAAVALHEVVSAFAPGHKALIKWPNDLLVDGAKLSGILLERADDAVVIGIGVNLAHAPEGLDRPVTSLARLTGSAPDPSVFLETLADSFARWLSRWRGQGLAPIRDRWLLAAHPVGTALTTEAGGQRLEGLFDGLDAGGSLRLRLADGGVHVIHAGDVFLI